MLLNRRFAGVERLFGSAGFDKIRLAHVAVVGVGGVGSWAAESLARSGVSEITLIDLDHIAESNVNRQVHALESTLGQAKVTAMADRIRLINPECTVHSIEEFVDSVNWPTVLPSGVCAVIDACDQTRAKTAMSAWALNSGTCFITVGAAGGKLNAQSIKLDDLSRVTHDPLLSKIRYQLRREFAASKAGEKIGIQCVYSPEQVAVPNQSCSEERDGSLNCSGYGSFVSVTATFGHCAAGWVLDQISRSTSDSAIKKI